MGMFSWIDVTGNENICDSDDKTILLIPKDHREEIADFFGVELTDTGIEGRYDGYGRVKGIDVYDVAAFLNICVCNDEQFEYVKRSVGSNTARDMEKIRQAYKEGFFESIRDFGEIAEELNLSGSSLGFENEFRSYGITLACYDEDNARLPYPIKLTVSDKQTYENSYFSMGDPNQGFCKTTRERLDAVTYREEDWNCYVPEYIDGDEINEETGEYEQILNPDYVEPSVLYEESDERYEYDRIKELDELDDERDKILNKIKEEREGKTEMNNENQAMSFEVTAFYDEKLAGISDRATDLTFEEAKDTLHEYISKGGYVQVRCNETGVDKVFNYDEYFEGFEGESPLQYDDFKGNAEDAQKYIDTYKEYSYEHIMETINEDKGNKGKNNTKGLGK